LIYSSLKTTYSSNIFSVLKKFFGQVSTWYTQQVLLDKLSPAVAAFLREHNLEEIVIQMKQQSTSQVVFFRRFWQWMDGFEVLKLVHYLRDNGFPN